MLNKDSGFPHRYKEGQIKTKQDYDKDRAAEKQQLRDQEQSELDWARLGHNEPIER